MPRRGPVPTISLLVFALGLSLAQCSIPSGDGIDDEASLLAPPDLDMTLPPAAVTATPYALPPDDGASWKVWGGPNRNFTSSASGLAETWPAEGPPMRWSRPLGDGRSAIAVETGVLYTMYHSGTEEVAVALNADDGTTKWESHYEPSFVFDSLNDPAGPGPYVMPQIVDDLVITAGASGDLRALDKASGELVWSHSLHSDFGATRMPYGYTNHPMPYKDLLVLMVGGREGSLMAMKASDGSVVWRRHGFRNAYSTPVLINVDGQDQVVAFLSKVIVGFDPNTGELLWQHPHETAFDLAIMMPVWGEDNLLLYSSADGGGCGVLQLKRVGDYTVAEQMWHSSRIRFHFNSLIRIGDIVYGSSGKSGATPMTAVNIRSGEILWQSRAVGKSNLLLGDGRLIVVDEDGSLGLANVSPTGLTVTSRARLFGAPAWTVPTLVGTTLYMRGRSDVMAFDLGR